MNQSFNLFLNQHLPFSHCPVSAKLSIDKIYANDVILPRSIDSDCGMNPHNVRLWVIGHEHGAICAVWASNEQDALNTAVDLNTLDCFMAEDQNYEDESLVSLGNAGELFDLSYAWIGEVQFDAQRDIQLIVALVRTSEAGFYTLGEYR